MGREIQRVPLDLDWPQGRTWFGYEIGVTFPPCWVCNESGYSQEAMTLRQDLHEAAGGYCHDHYRKIKETLGGASLCSRCEGHGNIATTELRQWADAMPDTPIPQGDGWQLWETVGDSPMSPVFEDAAGLTDWMTAHPWMSNPSLTGPSLVVSDRATAERFVSAGWAPSMVVTSAGGRATVQDGVKFVVKEAKK